MRCLTAMNPSRTTGRCLRPAGQPDDSVSNGSRKGLVHAILSEREDGSVQLQVQILGDRVVLRGWAEFLSMLFS